MYKGVKYMESKKIADFIKKNADRHIDENDLEKISGGEALWIAANDREFQVCPNCRIVIFRYNKSNKCQECGYDTTIMKNIDIPDDWELKWYWD